MAASKFQKKLQQKREEQKDGSDAVATASIASRTAEPPHGKPEASQMMSQIVRPAMEPEGQIIRVPIDEVYEVKQVRPEEDFEEETLAGMAESFNEFGNLTPPRCFPKDRNGYRVWFGATRIRSMRLRGDTHVDIYVGKPPRDDKQRIMGQLIENLQQSGLKPLATALAFEELKTVHNMTGEEIARAMGKPTAFVSKLLRIGAAPEKIKVLMRGHKLADIELIYTLLQVNELSGETADRLIETVKSDKALTRAAVKKELDRLKGRLSRKIKGNVEENISHAKSQPEARNLLDKNDTPEVSQQTGDTMPIQGKEKISHAKSQPAGKGEYETDKQPGEDVETQANLNAAELAMLNDLQGDVTPSSSDSKPARLKPVVLFEGKRGILLLDKIPEEWGYIWIRTQDGEFYIEASAITLLGVR